jgi:uncharacterized protein YecE (DUF72 family)
MTRSPDGEIDMRTASQYELFASQPSQRNAKSASGFDSIYIGCAGWNLASSVQDKFPAEGTHLERYARVFPAVEINSSFYRPHLAATYARWRDSVPDAFRFSVKMPRTITHQLRLENAESELLEFLAAVSRLERKLGCLLVQLPPSLRFNRSIANDFFSRLRSMTGADIACEPRHASWAALEADRVFEEAGIARVAADPAVIPMPLSPSRSSTVYVRLHGSPVIYHSAYSDEFLQRLAMELLGHVQRGRRVWCILDNTLSSTYIVQALHLLKLTRSAAP